MITIKSEREIELMRKAGKILADTFELIEGHVKSGVSTMELNNIAHEFILKNNSYPSFKNYNGYPGSICTSPNNEIVHGIPGPRKLHDGDIISIDIGVCYEGYHADAARTFLVGSVRPEVKEFVEVTKQSFFEGIKYATDGNRIGDVSAAIQNFVEEKGYSVVRELIGHGVGSQLHEDPDVPNFGTKGRGIRLKSGMTIAIEPMVNMGDKAIRQLKDGWTFVTKDNSLSAHYENTVLITEGECEILTLY